MLKIEFRQIIDKYFESFNDITGLNFDFWVDEYNLVGQFGNYIIDLNLIRFIVDENVPNDYFFNWHHFVTEFELTYSFKEYYKERVTHTEKNVFNIHKFEKLILRQMIKV